MRLLTIFRENEETLHDNRLNSDHFNDEQVPDTTIQYSELQMCTWSTEDLSRQLDEEYQRDSDEEFHEQLDGQLHGRLDKELLNN